jgi:DNA modification methylase
MNRIEFGDCRETMRRWASDGVRVQTCVTSPPYFGLRDYGHDGQIGLEQTPEEYITAMVEVFRCVKDVLANDGTLWLNIGDSYGKNKQRLMIPATVALALKADGWWLRDEIVWHKPRTTPSGVKDRTVAAHELIYLLAKSPDYYFDHKAIEEPAAYPNQRRKKSTAFRLSGGDGEIVCGDKRRKRSVWSINPEPYQGAHFATFPPSLIEPCILAGSRAGNIVLDPFMGSGTTAAVALQHGRQYLGCELNAEYEILQQERLNGAMPQKSPNLDLFEAVK